MRSLLLISLFFAYRIAFGQVVAPTLGQAQKASPWATVVSYAGNDTYMDHGRTLPGMQTLAWDSKKGSAAMNGCDWLQSAWIGQMGRLCSVESMGKANVVVIWRGAGPAPKMVDVLVESAITVRYQGSMAPVITLSNGLGSQAKIVNRLGGPTECAAKDSRVMSLPVSNGHASLSMAISGRAAGLMSGFIALQSELYFRPR